MPDNGSVNMTVNNRVATIVFHHPKGNCLTSSLLNDLTHAFSDAGGDKSARVIVLRSEGNGAFCAGASLDELYTISDYKEGKRFFMGFARVLNAMRACPKLIIARIQGKSVGGGVGLAAAADYVFAHTQSSVRLSELSLGIGPFVISSALIRKIGTSAFSSISLDARTWFDAEWAESKGLYNQTQATMDELNEAVSEFTGELARGNPDSMEELKKILWHGTDHWNSTLTQHAEISGRLAVSKHVRNYINDLKRGR